MARLNDNAQWLVLLGFSISMILIFLAIILNQSITVGQTTAESVLGFPKEDIKTFRDSVRNIDLQYNMIDDINLKPRIQQVFLEEKLAVVDYWRNPDQSIQIHFNDGTIIYDERIVNAYDWYY